MLRTALEMLLTTSIQTRYPTLFSPTLFSPTLFPHIHASKKGYSQCPHQIVWPEPRPGRARTNGAAPGGVAALRTGKMQGSQPIAC